jgi:hypothetical protein
MHDPDLVPYRALEAEYRNALETVKAKCRELGRVKQQAKELIKLACDQRDAAKEALEIVTRQRDALIARGDQAARIHSPAFAHVGVRSILDTWEHDGPTIATLQVWGEREHDGCGV